MDFLPQKTFTNFNFRKHNSKNKLKLPRIDTAFISYHDYERIRKNALITDKDENFNNERIQKEQEETQLAKANALKQKVKNIQKRNLTQTNYNKYEGNDLMLEAKKNIDKNEDCVKQMNKLSLYAKVATIRDRQLQEHEMMEDLFKKKEKKLDEMMELERLKELKQQQIRDNHRKQLQKDGCMIIIEQIKQKEYDRIRQKDIIEKDRQMILRQIKEMQMEDIRQAEKKRIIHENTAKEIVELNKISALNKQKKLLEEKEEDLKMLKYNIEKAKKEENELKEKKRIREEKEREVQKLREKQEKANDKLAEMAAIQAKRAYEQNERELKLKEKNEEIMKQKKIDELKETNERLRQEKKKRLMDICKQEKEESEKIKKKNMEDIENDRRNEEIRKKKLIENKNQLIKLIKIKEEKEKMEIKELKEEGRKERQLRDDWKLRMENIKKQKIQELKNLGIKQKYIADLENYKIV